MKTSFLFALFLGLLCPTARPVAAADVKVSGLIYTHYEAVTSKYLSNGAKAEGRNEFDVSRVYLNAGADHDEHLASFVQLEANLVSRDPLTSGSTNQVYLKQAWLEYKGIYPGAKLQFGLVPGPWRAYEEGIWKHRFVAKVLEDEEGLLNPTDRGVRLSGKASLIAYDLMVANGEGPGARGTAGNESNKYKEATAKLAVGLFEEGDLAGLKLNALAVRGQKLAGWERNRAFGGFSYESGKVNAMATYFTARDGKSVATGTDTVKGAGFSVHTTVKVSKSCWVFARYDQWDPDTNAADNARRRLIAGAGHALADNVRMAVDYQALIQEKQTAKVKDQGLASLHLEVKF